MFTKVKDFFKKENVCCIAFLLAVVSMFFIPPSVNYFSYIDFRVLALLFCPADWGKSRRPWYSYCFPGKPYFL